MKSPKNQKSHISASSLPISEKRLTQISDRYLQLIYDTTPVEVLLKPMKGNSRKYRKYIIQLGKLDKRSPRVREKIVPFSVELYLPGPGLQGAGAACGEGQGSHQKGLQIYSGSHGGPAAEI
ncbi:hypothetical protein [Acidaminococcus fermentans]|uniref:hypothetical protein n=1 Tax=Acidaminococcus fermentans TaxID=905 RepID=UPI00307A6579